jgi:hypothetical protein
MALSLAAGVLLIGLTATAAPAPAAKQGGEGWEYCELQSSYTITRVAPGGVGVGAVPAPGVAGRVAVTRVRKTVLRYVTEAAEVEAPSWEELASKLKAPAPKAKATEAMQKLRVLNHLGRGGWELTGHNRDSSSAADVWTFKRKVVK